MSNVALSRSRVFHAREGTGSMKGTIPSDIVSALKLKHGDQVEWEITAENNQIVVKLRKSRS